MGKKHNDIKTLTKGAEVKTCMSQVHETIEFLQGEQEQGAGWKKVMVNRVKKKSKKKRQKSWIHDVSLSVNNTVPSTLVAEIKDPYNVKN